MFSTASIDATLSSAMFDFSSDVRTFESRPLRHLGGTENRQDLGAFALTPMWVLEAVQE